MCFPPVHSQPQQQQLAVLPGGQNALVKAEAKEAVPGRRGKTRAEICAKQKVVLFFEKNNIELPKGAVDQILNARHIL